MKAQTIRIHAKFGGKMELKLDKITKHYGAKTAVSDVEFILTPGVWGLLGENGAGKTTLMRIIAGILRPSSGSVRLDGIDIADLGEIYREQFGYLPQTFGYYPEFNVQDYLEYIACLKGLGTRETKAKIGEMAELMGLGTLLKKKIRKLSGGMQRRVGIAQALLNDPQILILDEPTSGLDPGERVYFRNIISEFSQDRIVMISTHIVADVEYIAYKNAMMRDGKIIALGKTEDLVTQIKDKVFETIIPTESYNLFERSVCVINMKNLDRGKVLLRYVSDSPKTPDSQSVEPRLEDLYLWEFKETTTGRGVYQ